MSTNIGNLAEDAAAEHLTRLGYEVLDRNWRTRVCEIDIVAKKNNIVYFVEVKYRSSSDQGTGLEYITPKKLDQMKFAATCWIEDAKWLGDYRLAGIEVTGDYEVTEMIDSIE